MPHSSSHFDAADAARRLMHNPQLLTRVLTLFVQQVPTMLSQLDKAIEQHDHQQISMLLHTLKGNAGQVGAQRLYHHFKVCEYELTTRPEQLPARVSASYRLFDKFVEVVKIQHPTVSG
ncbi:Hpt domain-containing protein [Salinimonas marina]|uniref:Hpt domain-containing protein n=1 Tax=Salinimonas marina TaxID=2785918 RepID=A0A7S9HD87_9ALTE|nr:Hpt domain-containing protein [Salinimonas marina]QPG06051.1 Hpt domain-containing protein [Salinimonas marina]